MRHHAILPILLLSLAAVVSPPAAATTYPYAVVATIPAAPAPGDQVVLTLWGEWSDTCVPNITQASLTREGTALRVHLNYAGFSGACGAAITPWSLNVAAGVLEEGDYTVDVTLGRSILPAETIGSGSFTVVPPAEALLWLPTFSATSDGYTLASSLTAFNNTDRSGTVEVLGAWDAKGERAPGTEPVAIDPSTAAVIPTDDLREGQPVQMLGLKAPGRFAFRATLERLELVPEGSPKVPESLGRVELPVFTALVAAGQTAVAGDVSLTPSECAGTPEQRRRVNLTLFNAGDVTATFTVVGAVVGTGPGGGAPPVTYAVPARSLVQFNALPIELFPVCEDGGAWFRITGDQPFLAYVSTVRPQSVPGVLPYEIFPARTDR